MLTFFSDCAGLFTLTFNAIVAQEFFFFLLCFLVVMLSMGLFCFLSRKSRRMI